MNKIKCYCYLHQYPHNLQPTQYEYRPVS